MHLHFSLGGKCSHVGALLFRLQEFKRLNTTDLACTSKLCRWSGANVKAIQPRQLSDIPFQRARIDKGSWFMT